MRTLVLVDGDIIAYTAAAAVERTTLWDDDTLSITADLDEAKNAFDTVLAAGLKEVEDADAEVIMVFSPNGPVFRHGLWPTYKEGRKRKPMAVAPLKEWASERFKTKVVPNLEADDVLGILATHPRNLSRRRVIVTGDKDLAQIPCNILDIKRQTWTEVEEEDADLTHLIQTLTGDTTDNYPGCPGIGAKRAPSIAAGGWEAVVAAYEKAKLTEEDALLQARLARILRFTDYDHTNKEPLLWRPH